MANENRPLIVCHHLMPIHFTCPHCNIDQSLPQNQVRRARPCPVCGASITVPDRSDTTVLERQTARFHRRLAREQPRFQFGLKHLAVVMTACCVLFAMAASTGVAGVLAFCFLALMAIGIYLHNVGIIAAVFAIELGLCLLPTQPPTPGRRRVPCQSHLRQLALAMHQYNDIHGTLPPAYFADANGKPMHSWRVLLLPYLGPDAIKPYRQYNFAEPWDGPNNRRLADQTPKFFACPQDRYRKENHTSYVVVTGKETVFNAGQSMSLNQLAAMDGTSVTLLVVECAESGIHWMEPRDLPYDQMTLKINDSTGKKGVRSHHLDGANVGMADASCKFVSQRVDPTLWKSVFTADGGEPGFVF